MKVGILRNENPNSSYKWEIACKRYGIKYEVIDLTSFKWFEEIKNDYFDFFLTKPSGSLTHFKNMYDERLFIISKVLKSYIYPSYEECYIYENKKLLYYYLAANNISHPNTYVFYCKNEALNFINTDQFPLVAKTSIGASGSGVTVLRNTHQAKKYIEKAYSLKGIKRRFGPNRAVGTPGEWFVKSIRSPSYLVSKIKQYLSIYSHGERDLIIFQEYIPHDYEWRIVRIGDSYFGHQKIKQGDKASGTKGIDYVDPPKELLNFVKALCDNHGFHFMAIDLFEDGKGGYLVNEMQTIFGHIQDYILAVEGKPGRYIYRNKNWVFEEGNFNTNESYDLRLKVALELYEREK